MAQAQQLLARGRVPATPVLLYKKGWCFTPLLYKKCLLYSCLTKRALYIQLVYKKEVAQAQQLLARARVPATPVLLYRAVQFSIQEQVLSINVERFRGGLVFKAHRLLYHSTPGSRVKKKKRKAPGTWPCTCKASVALQKGLVLYKKRLVLYKNGISHRCFTKTALYINLLFKKGPASPLPPSRGRVPATNPDYRGTSLLRNSAPLGPYSRHMPRALRWS